jgi:hypothetical protein
VHVTDGPSTVDSLVPTAVPPGAEHQGPGRGGDADVCHFLMLILIALSYRQLDGGSEVILGEKAEVEGIEVISYWEISASSWGSACTAIPHSWGTEGILG